MIGEKRRFTTLGGGNNSVSENEKGREGKHFTCGGGGGNDGKYDCGQLMVWISTSPTS